MAISSEYAQAVRDNNKLRVRIMLKDSLLIDKSFRLFEEMQEYALAQGVNPWADVDIPLEKSEKPWTEDTMNYELIALVNDFTKEHVNYIKEIITDLYKTDIASPDKRYVSDVQVNQRAERTAIIRPTNNDQIGKGQDPYKTIVVGNRNINMTLRKTVDSVTNKRRWLKEDISDIKRNAQRIIDACNEIQRRG